MLAWLMLMTAASEHDHTDAQHEHEHVLPRQLRRQRRRRGGWRRGDEATKEAEQKNVIIFGPPGVGKGTQSAQIQQAYGLCHVSTGDILRREIAKKSRPGLRAEGYVSRGEMVPHHHKPNYPSKPTPVTIPTRC